MPYVETSIAIAAPRHKIYELAKDMERYSDFMPDVEYVKVLHRNGNVTVTRWKERPVGVRTYVPVMEIVPSEIAVYLSVLRVGGAQYDVLESAALGG